MHRAFIIAVPVLVVLLAALAGEGEAPAEPAQQELRPPGAVRPVGEADGVFPYRFERGGLHYADVLTLRDGSKRLGKAMEWADQVLLFDADGRPAVFGVADNVAQPPSAVERIEFRRAARHKVRPELPDLTVAYVERLPRDPSWQGHVALKDGVEVADFELDRSSWHPAPGAPVTFRAHVLNAGGADSAAVSWRISVDDAELNAGNLPAVKPGAEQVIEAVWPWQEGRHTLRVEIDPGGSSPEIVRWNNTLAEPTDALAVTVVVSAERRRAFSGVANIVDSFCFEDWVRYQIAALNGLFAASVHPSCPQGILERVRCDRLIVLEDADDPQRRAEWESGLHRDGKPDGPAEYAALWVSRMTDGGAAPEYEALKVDWAALRDISRQLGLIGLTKTNTTIEQCLVLDQFGRYAQRHYLFPMRRTMMYTAGGFPFDERSTAFLNQMRGRPRGFSGDFLYQLPERIVVEVRSNAGTPLADVQVDVFQLMAEGEFAGAIAGAGRGEPLYSATTGPDGRLTLVDLPAPAATAEGGRATLHQTPGGYGLRPNPFGKIAPDESNGLLLLRLRLGGGEEFHFLSLFDCNVGDLRGQSKEYVRELSTRLAPPEAPVAPLYVAARMEDRTAPKPPLHLRWRMPPETDYRTLEEFRFYRRTSFGGDDSRPWTLYSIVAREGGRFTQSEVDGTYFDEFRRDVPYSLDTFHAVSAVDREGRESRLSAPAYLAYGKDSLKLTMDFEAAYITVTGDGPGQMLRWDGTAGTQPYGVRTRAFPGYVPGFWGIVMGTDGRLIVTDPVNHLLAFYDRGDLVEVVPSRPSEPGRHGPVPWWPGFPSDEPGEFYAPADVAVDDGGNIYVADFGNNRVQVLDSRGQFKALVDEGFRWDGPQAVGFSHGRLCVTDAAGTRCRVYDCRHREGEAPAEPVFVCQLPELLEADRGVMSKSGKVFIGGRDVKTGSAGILSYIPEGEGAKFETVGTEGVMGRFHRPRGLYVYRGGDDDYVYFVNEFPFDVGMHKME